MADAPFVVTVALVCAYVFPAAMAFAAASDLVTMTIPNKLSLALCGGFVGAALTTGMTPWAMGMHLVAALLVLAVGFGFFVQGWIGGGDAKLAAATALWLGFDLLAPYLLSAALAGGVLTVWVVMMRYSNLPAYAAGWGWLRRLHDPQSGIPYGIALAAAALIVYPYSPFWLAVAAR